MSPSLIALLIMCCLALGFAATVGWKSLRISQPTKSSTAQAAVVTRIQDDRRLIRLLPKPSGRMRDSSIAGIAKNLLRHRDGSYTKAYHVQLTPSMFDHDEKIERRIDELARLLASRKPTNTVIQFRLSVSQDRGQALQRHLASKDYTNIPYSASLLHMMGVEFYEAAASQGAFRRHTLSAWVRVPAKHMNDESRKASGSFFPALRRELRSRGPIGFLAALAIATKELSSDSITQRTRDEEKLCIENAEKTFRQLEHQSPVKLVPFTRDELWEAIYLGHRQNSQTTPILAPNHRCDIKDYLCAETISGQGDFLMHGNYPATVVSLFVPPQPEILRRLHESVDNRSSAFVPPHGRYRLRSP